MPASISAASTDATLRGIVSARLHELSPANPAKMRDFVRAGLALLVLPECARAFALALALTNSFIVRARPGGKWV